MLAASIAPTTAQATPSPTAPSGPLYSCSPSFASMSLACTGTNAATIAQFKSLQTLINQAMLKGNYNGSNNGTYIGVPGGRLLTVNGVIDSYVQQALLWLSSTFGGVLAIYDVSFTPDYIAANVARITTSLLTFLGVSAGRQVIYGLRVQPSGASTATGQKILVVTDPGPTVNPGAPTPNTGAPNPTTGAPPDPCNSTGNCTQVTGGGGQGTQVTPIINDGCSFGMNADGSCVTPPSSAAPSQNFSTYAVIGVGLGIVAALFGLHHS